MGACRLLSDVHDVLVATRLRRTHGFARIRRDRSLRSLVPHLLFTGSIAMAALLLWMPIRHVIIRASLATALALAGMNTAQGMVENWGPHDPVLSGHAPMQCSGKAPVVCMPKLSADHLPMVRKQVDSVLSKFRAAGVEASPRSITDSLADGRRYVRSTPSTWRVSLTRGAEAGNVRYLLVNAAVRFPCDRPDPELRREALLWASTIAGESEAYAKQWDHSPEEFDSKAANRERVRADVKTVRTLSVPEQADWFARTVVTACERGAAVLDVTLHGIAADPTTVKPHARRPRSATASTTGSGRCAPMAPAFWTRAAVRPRRSTA